MAGSVTKGQVIEGRRGRGHRHRLPASLPPNPARQAESGPCSAARTRSTWRPRSTIRGGLKLMKKGRYDEALESFKRVLGVYENAEVYYNMGYICTAPRRVRIGHPLLPQGHRDQPRLCPRLSEDGRGLPEAGAGKGGAEGLSGRGGTSTWKSTWTTTPRPRCRKC